jgi:hypothetical protein
MTDTRRRGNTSTGTKEKVGFLNRYSFRFFDFVNIPRMLCKKNIPNAKSLQLRLSFSEKKTPLISVFSRLSMLSEFLLAPCTLGLCE